MTNNELKSTPKKKKKKNARERPACLNMICGLNSGSSSVLHAYPLVKIFVTVCGIVYVSPDCRHHQHGRWQARIGRVAGNKDLYLGTFSECFFDLAE